jgi:hypothetical protein
LVEGRAPDALSGLPAPDAIFIGGGLDRLPTAGDDPLHVVNHASEGGRRTGKVGLGGEHPSTVIDQACPVLEPPLN